MTPREIIDVQLESFFGSKFPQKIQRMVNDELNQGRWVDGYDLAVSLGGSVIEGNDARELLKIVLTQHPALRIDEAALRMEVESQLPLSLHSPVSWIVDESGAFALTDGLKVARFEGASMVWRSPEIAFDGIDFDSLSEGKLRGRAWWMGSHETPQSRFTIDFETGEMLEGQFVQPE